MAQPGSTLNTAEEPIAKRRKLSEQNIILRDLTADQFRGLTKMFFSSPVTVLVGGQDFIFPKDLLCYNSSFFESALNSKFKESLEQKVTLEEVQPDTFQLIAQWIFQGQMKLPSHATPNEDIGDGSTKNGTTTTSNSGERVESCSIEKQGQQSITVVALTERQTGVLDITRYLEFFELAVYLDLLGPFNSVTDVVKKILLKDKLCLEPSHIRLCMRLPVGHPIRQLMVRASVKSYIRKLVEPGFTKFRFQAEVDDLCDYAGELFREVGKSFDKKRSFQNRSSYKHTYTFIDPFTDQTFDIHPSFPLY